MTVRRQWLDQPQALPLQGSQLVPIRLIASSIVMHPPVAAPRRSVSRHATAVTDGRVSLPVAIKLMRQINTGSYFFDT